MRTIYTFTIPRERFDESSPDKQILRQLISKHISLASKLRKNIEYYEGKHKILGDTERENKLVCNHAKDISDTVVSYFIGNPVSYKSSADITVLTDALEDAGADEADGDNGLELSIYGLAYEYIYTPFASPKQNAEKWYASFSFLGVMTIVFRDSLVSMRIKDLLLFNIYPITPISVGVCSDFYTSFCVIRNK